MFLEKQYKIGKYINISLWINIFLIAIYLVDTIIIFPIISENILTFFARKPVFIILIKCFYAFIILISILSINKRPNLAWFTLNLAAVGILSLWIFSFTFYTSLMDSFLLELSAVWLLFLSNQRFFVEKYKIKRKPLNIALSLIIPILILIIINLKILSSS